MKIRINKYKLKNFKVKESKIILNLSDIHGNIKALDNIIKFVKKSKIDYILIPGDIVDSLNQNMQKEFIEKVKQLAKYSKVYASIGNHDVALLKKGLIQEKEYNNYTLFKELNNTLDIKLFTKNIEYLKIDNGITITALNLPNYYYQSKEKKSSFNKYLESIENKVNINKNNFNIMLCHSPNCLASKNKIIDNKIINNMNLILSGHNHGGLVLPKIQDIINNHYGLVGPYNKIIQKNAYGIISNKNISLFISNGVTKMSESSPFKPLHKIGNKIFIPEIDLIYLENGISHEMKLVEREVHEYE